MAEVTEKRRCDYSGLDADKATIPAGGKAVGDRYLATDTKILYFWDGVAWIIIPDDVITTVMIKNLNVTKGKAELGFGRFVPRLTNNFDFSGGNPTGAAVDFTTDGDWKPDGLDLSGIVPAGAIAVALRIGVTDDAAVTYFIVRHSVGYGKNSIQVTTTVANIGENVLEVIAIDTNRLLDYRGADVDFTGLDVTVVGWFI